MTPTKSENCVICRKYYEFREQSVKLHPKYKDEFYAMLRVKTFERGQKTPLVTTSIWEAKIQFCPRCGAKWQVPRRRSLPKEMRRKRSENVKSVI